MPRCWLGPGIAPLMSPCVLGGEVDFLFREELDFSERRTRFFLREEVDFSGSSISHGYANLGIM